MDNSYLQQEKIRAHRNEHEMRKPGLASTLVFHVVCTTGYLSLVHLLCIEKYLGQYF